MAREIVVVNRKTDKVKHYHTIAQGSKDLGFSKHYFYNALKGKTNALTDAGYLIYEYAEYYELMPVREHNTNVKPVKYPRAVYMLDPYTHEILDEFRSIRAAGEDVGGDPASIRRCCLGTCKTAHGYKWEYVG